ncbi:MAG TPA: hypothetical protein VMT63_02265 [Bacteroidales bacterium]|nr:hypothetical protein [Bacteroidales bacterium]
MDFSSNIDIIIKDLKEIGDIVDDFSNYPGVPALQVEIVKSKCRYACEIIEKLRPVDKGEAKPEVVEERIHEPAPEPVNVGDFSLAAGKPPEADEVKDDDSEAHGSLRKANDISTVIKSIPLPDISTAIRMNERFLFIREIFRGDAAAYEEAVSKLNKAESLQDAKAIIMSYTGDSRETEAISHLLEIVKRKFPENG